MAALMPSRSASSAIVQHRRHRLRPVLGTVTRHQVSGLSVVDRVPQPADVGRHHRPRAGLGLQRDQPEGLVVRRALRPGRRRSTSGTAPSGPSAGGSPRDRRRPSVGGQRRERVGPVGVGAARAADDDQAQPLPAGRLGPDQLGDGLDQHVGRLERLDPADEQDHLGPERHAELGPGPRLIAGVERVQVHPGRDDGDLLGPGAVEARSARSPRRGCWRSARRLRRRSRPRRRSRTSGSARWAVAQGGVLHPGHGVHGVDQRHPVPLLELDPGHTGEPVVGVHEVVLLDHGVEGRRRTRPPAPGSASLATGSRGPTSRLITRVCSLTSTDLRVRRPRLG